MNINFLRIPLFKLNYIDDVDSFSGLTTQELKSLKNEYTDSELDEIVESVRWAIKNPDYDFLSLSPDLKYDNEGIYKYLCKLEGSMKGL